MAKVVLPLGSSSAHGRVGTSAVYQGTWAREYVRGRDPKSIDQLAVRSLFLDFTKMLKSAGLFARGAFKAWYGPRWWTEFYRVANENGRARWLAAGAVFDGLDVEIQSEWTTAAPWPTVSDDAGRIFFSMIKIAWDFTQEFGRNTFLLSDPLLVTGFDILTWWQYGLDQVLSIGEYSGLESVIGYSSGWSTISDALAYGGSYKKSSGSAGLYVGFFFIGTRFRYRYLQGPLFGTVQIYVDDAVVSSFSLYAGSDTYGNYFVSALLGSGLHDVTISAVGASVINLDGIEIL